MPGQSCTRAIAGRLHAFKAKPHAHRHGVAQKRAMRRIVIVAVGHGLHGGGQQSALYKALVFSLPGSELGFELLRRLSCAYNSEMWLPQRDMQASGN